MKFVKTILPNGVRLITIPMPESPTVTFMVLVEAGSKYESAELSGVSHFLEHFLFKGTTKRPKPVDISRDLDALGAQYNAFTGQEYTGYFAKTHKEKANKALDIISDMFLDPKLPLGEFSKERGVILQEISMYEDEPMRHVQDLFMELLYGDQPAGRNIAGTKESLSKLTQKDLVAYWKNYYVAESTVVVVAGAFNEKQLVKRIRSLFGKMPSTKKPEKRKVVESQSQPEILLGSKKTDQAHIVLGVRAFSTFDPKVPVLRVLSTILGGGMSSRLFVKLRDELGICYYVGASPDLYTDHGLFQVSAGVDVARTDIALKAIMGELKKLTRVLPSEAELRKVKDYLIGNLYLSLESSDEYAQFHGMQEVIRKPLSTMEEVTKRIESVKASDVRDLARVLFKTENLNLAVVGPFEDKKFFLPFLEF